MKQTGETRATMNTRNIRKTCYSSRRQQGGTFLGIIVGLVVGLGIAVVVALVITKSPIPFTNGKTLRPEHTPDPTAEQVTDPNKLLYGSKEVARQTARDQAKAEAGAAPGGGSQTSQAAAGVLPPVVAAIPASTPVPSSKVSDTAEPKNQVSSTSTAASKADSDDRWTYYLQAGAFRDQADAENARAKLALLGMEARVSEKQSDNGSLYRVRLGPYAQLDAMNRVRTKLAENSVDAALVRIPK
jgi:cell division protein FtsN